MLTKRIIPCLDIKNGRTVKGTRFVDIRDAGDPVSLACAYAKQGADELVLLDITATNEKRKTFQSIVKDVAAAINIPFTVGGGISSIKDVEILLKNGADKVSVNSAAIANPGLVKELSIAFGSQAIVLAIDAKNEGDEWNVYSGGGSKQTVLTLFEWAKKGEEQGAGEILFTSMSHDGTKDGFALEALSTLSDLLSIPVIASGGAGSMEHFREAFESGKADAALAASVFHYNEISIPQLKQYLSAAGIHCRLN